MNSFLDNSSTFPAPRFPAALAARALLLDAHGRPVDVASGPGISGAGVLDLSVSHGMRFASSMIADQLAAHSSGWMADFGE